MLKTTNYQMNKPELADSPPDITVLNGNFDIIDEKLFAVIQAWEEFKANGGKIGGGYLGAFANGLVFGKDGVPDSRVQTLYSGDINMFGPSESKKVSLGHETNAWKEAWVGNFSKQTNGYTKLSNGFILQWGRMMFTEDSAKSWQLYLNFPIEFPTACWTVVGNISSQDTNTNARITAGYIIPYTKKQFKTRGGGIGLPYEHTVASTEINWFAIGN
ncbi:MAG: hypothetical protein KHZ99_15340 [Clostridium sp.]|uniref:gp53-like domain-containing protein n=1 Tax=Clostridium sp. TaxID=1506 RepID=UPI0025C5EFE9|nr:hypothetical protein [Clostridium sp.]MBS4958398.1 hypothetical protein [Clostridium sp.]